MSRSALPRIKKAYDVFGQRIEVELKKGPLYLDSGFQVRGYYEVENKKIVVDSTMSKDQIISTLYHELGHALLYRLGIDQTSTSHDVHEMIVEGYSKFIMESFKLK